MCPSACDCGRDGAVVCAREHRMILEELVSCVQASMRRMARKGGGVEGVGEGWSSPGCENESLGSGMLHKARRGLKLPTSACTPCWTARETDSVLVHIVGEQSRPYQLLVLHSPLASEFGKLPSLTLKCPALHLFIRQEIQRAIAHPHQRERRAAVEPAPTLITVYRAKPA